MAIQAFVPILVWMDSDTHIKKLETHFALLYFLTFLQCDPLMCDVLTNWQQTVTLLTTCQSGNEMLEIKRFLNYL